jgi:hypothetical protein
VSGLLFLGLFRTVATGGLTWVRDWRSGRRRFLTLAGMASLTACAAVPDVNDYLGREGAAEPVDATSADTLQRHLVVQ